MKLALVPPADTVATAGTTAVPSLESATFAPPAGAGPVRVTVAVVSAPPMTVDGLTTIDASCGPPTERADDCRLAPFIDAVIVTLPGVTPVTEKVPVVPPAATVTDAGTVATALLLLDSEITAPLPDVALANVTVPWRVDPSATFEPENVTLVMLPLVGIVGEPEPHAAAARAANTATARSR